jgi:YD repeat-containing protein
MSETGNPARGNVFVTADGTSATFVSDNNIYDDPFTDGASPLLSGYLLLRDGTRYRFDNNKLSWIRDRNGNKLTFSYTINQQTQAITTTTVTDSLNRQVLIERDVTDATYGLCDRITYKGIGGATRILYATKTSLSSALRSGYSVQLYYDLFPTLNGSSGSGYFNPTVINALRLPNGKQYQFKYNSYGELARVVLPTDGAIEYDWQAGDSTTESAGGVVAVTAYDYGVYRRVAERRVYADGTTLEQKMVYPRAAETDSNTQSNAAVETRDASNNLLAKTRHYYFGSARRSFGQSPVEYSKWKEGKEKKTEAYDSDGTTVLRMTE